MKKTDIPGYDAQDEHGYYEQHDVESWLQEHGFDVIYENRYNSSQFAYWNKDEALLVLTAPDKRSPELGEFQVFDAPDLRTVNSLCDTWWAE